MQSEWKAKWDAKRVSMPKNVLLNVRFHPADFPNMQEQCLSTTIWKSYLGNILSS
jgi:hypothetical protein